MRKTLGKYRLIAEIGRGGMASVFLAVSQGPGGFNKLVVIKEPKLDATEDADVLTMFMDEARLAARLNHPNVVQTYEVGVEEGRHFIAMEYLEGQSMSRIRSALFGHDRFRPLMLHITKMVLEGLQHAHDLKDFDGTSLGVVHRDVTPHNVFVTYDGHVKLVDFGIAKAASSSARTRTGVLKGKLKYMSPEQIANEPLDRRADVYAVGVMLWETLTGTRLFKDVNDAALLHKIVTGSIPRVRDLAPDTPPALVDICEKALATDREDRYLDARAMQRDVAAYLDTLQPRPDTHELSQTMLSLFAEERAKIKGVIETHITDIRATMDSLPVISSMGRSLTPSTGASLNGVSPTQSGTLPSQPVTSPPPRRSVVLPVLGVVFVGVGLVVATQMSGQGDAEEASAAASALPSTQDLPPSMKVGLEVQITPPDAKLYLDDAFLAQGAYDGHLPKGNRVYRLRAEAPGYESQVQLFEANEDVSLAIELTEGTTKPSADEDEAKTPEPKPRPRVVVVPRPAKKPEPEETEEPPPPPAPPTSDFTRRPSASNPGKVDKNNPYAN